ncbi:MAG: sodium:solute symporter family protein [candidate division Zixibacteria bacterium]|nr:sodium:solute symporter family protein [candidate division Zixibacteria bacterium]
MTISWFDSSIVIAYLLILFVFALFGLRRKNGSQENLILAGRRLTLPAFVATLVSTWYGGILGVGEFSYLYGISNWLVFGVPYYLAALIFALFLAKRARRSMEMTIPDRLAKNYGPAASAAGSAVLIIVTLPVAYVLMIGVLLNQFFALPIWIGIIAGTAFSVFYVMTGGFKAVLWTDIFQFILMFAGFIILFIVAFTTFGGLEYLKANIPETHLSASGGNPVGYIALWYIIALATLVEPAFYQRCFAAKSEKVARRGIFVSIGFWIFFDFLTTTCGLYARAILPNLDNPVAAYPALAMEILPVGLLGIFLLSLLATIMSTVDSYMFLAATTISHDLIWRFKKFDEYKIGRYTALGLLISSIGTVGIALLSDSVVDLWHDFGSVGTPALLLPLLTSYWGKYKYSNKGALLSIILSSTLTALALFYPTLSGTSGYLFGIEPIFIGLGISLVILLATITEKQSQLIDK